MAVIDAAVDLGSGRDRFAMTDGVVEGCVRHVSPHGRKDAVIASGLFAKLRIANGQLHSTIASRVLITSGSSQFQLLCLHLA